MDGYIVNGAASAKSLINGLLNFARITAKPEDFVVVDITEVVKGIADEVAIANPAATISHRDLPAVLGDAALLRLLFQNLCLNAVKYHRPDLPPNIKISASEDKPYWRFAVTDNGIGIPSQFYQKIFQMFQRLHARVQYPGEGLGLSICQKVVELHGGTIWVESTVGEGSTFYFQLPMIVASD